MSTKTIVSPELANNVEYQYYLNSLIQDSKKLKLLLWAIHNKTRIKMLNHLAHNQLSVKDLSHRIEELHSVTSFHLRHLRKYNLVQYREVGKERIYGVTDIVKPMSILITEGNSIISTYEK